MMRQQTSVFAIAVVVLPTKWLYTIDQAFISKPDLLAIVYCPAVVLPGEYKPIPLMIRFEARISPSCRILRNVWGCTCTPSIAWLNRCLRGVIYVGLCWIGEWEPLLSWRESYEGDLFWWSSVYFIAVPDLHRCCGRYSEWSRHLFDWISLDQCWAASTSFAIEIFLFFIYFACCL